MRKKVFLLLLILIIAFVLRSKDRFFSRRFNFVFISDSIAVASLEWQKDLNVLVLPQNLYLEIPDDYGYYQLGSVYQLGALENKGAELLIRAIENYLAVPIDGFIKLPSCLFIQSPHCLLLAAVGRGETNFYPWQIVKVWWEIKSLRADKIKTIDFQETNILTEKSLPDGTQIYETEFFRLDEIVRKHFEDKSLAKERLKIEILNASGKPGLAKKMNRLMTNLGGEVINLGNSEEKIENTKIICIDKSIKNSYTVQKLEATLGIQAEVDERDISRAEILILVSED